MTLFSKPFIHLLKPFFAFFIYLFSSWIWASEATHYPFLALDTLYLAKLPKNFRMASDPLSNDHVSTTGLKALHIMGSGQFSESMLPIISRRLPQGSQLIVVDLRQETHGFINGYPVSLLGKHNWVNINKTDQQIQEVEAKWLAGMRKQSKIPVFTMNKTTEPPILTRSVQPIQVVSSEAELVKKYHWGYQRIYVTDHCRPTDRQVNQFVAFVKHLPNKTWLYFHCRAGKGRTTTFMAMYDMMHNAKKVSYEDILKRQNLLGGADLLHLPQDNPKKQHYKACYQSRQAFLQSFYFYCRNNQDHYATPFLSVSFLAPQMLDFKDNRYMT